MHPLSILDSPAAIIDLPRMQLNVQRMQQRMDTLGVRFRPHAKTSKCMPVVRSQIDAGEHPAQPRLRYCCTVPRVSPFVK
jgi:D-serine deaminase-like pyridoxal phosphate-dependent protein